ncbi:MAG: DUF6660 family protein [Bacteroidia bacterium]
MRCVTFVIVKITSFIISLIIIAISATPCADIQPAMDQNGIALIGNAGDQQESHSDCCSPLCCCNCCHTTAYVQIIYFSAVSHYIKILSGRQNTIYTSVLFSKYHVSIWQPPKTV